MSTLKQTKSNPSASVSSRLRIAFRHFCVSQYENKRNLFGKRFSRSSIGKSIKSNDSTLFFRFCCAFSSSFVSSFKINFRFCFLPLLRKWIPWMRANFWLIRSCFLPLFALHFLARKKTFLPSPQNFSWAFDLFPSPPSNHSHSPLPPTCSKTILVQYSLMLFKPENCLHYPSTSSPQAD